TQGTTIGQSSQAQPPTSADPWGQERRYRPGDTSTVAQPPPILESRPGVLPQTGYLSIKSANLKVIAKKIQELNQQLVSSGSKDISLNPPEIDTVIALCSQLDSPEPLKEQSPITQTGIF